MIKRASFGRCRTKKKYALHENGSSTVLVQKEKAKMTVVRPTVMKITKSQPKHLRFHVGIKSLRLHMKT